MEKEKLLRKKERILIDKNILYRFKVLEIKNEANNYQFEITEESQNKIKEKIKFNTILKNFNERYFQDFCLFYIYTEKIKKDIKNNIFDYDQLPKKKSAKHLKIESISYNIKKANEGDLKKLKNLKVWRDEYSTLTKEELLTFIEDQESMMAEKELEKIRTSKKRKADLINKIYRWCIRGLNIELAIKKVIETYKTGLYISKRRGKYGN